MNVVYPIIGMSPGNSYFKDEEVKYLLQETISRFGHVAILVADIPAAKTYVALGYPEGKALSKARLKGNNLKNRTIRLVKELGYSEKVKIVDWNNEVKENPNYIESFKRIQKLYDSSSKFSSAVDQTTRSVLESSGRNIIDIQAATKTAVYYLLSELAFLEFAPNFFNQERITYIYHRNWPVYEDFISGKFDGELKHRLDFLLLENPYETYKSYQPPTNGVIKAAYSNYPPAFMTNSKGEHSGIFFELTLEIAKRLGLEISFTEETGYGVIIKGLNDKRFDIFCSTVWPTPERLSEASFSTSIYESLVHIWASEQGVTKKNKKIQDGPDLRVAIKEGDISDSIANAEFPLSRKVRVPQLASPDTLLLLLVEDKADITFVEPSLANLFNMNREVKVTSITNQPIRKYSNCFMFRKGDELQKKVNTVLASMTLDGTLNRILGKYKQID